MKGWVAFFFSIPGALVFIALACLMAYLIYRMNIRQKKKKNKGAEGI